MRALPHPGVFERPPRPGPLPGDRRHSPEHDLPAPNPSPRTARLAISLATLLLAGCNTWHPAPIDLHQASWTTTRGQAVWHPAHRDVELAGELLIATTPDGQGYLQFAKGPVLLAEARTDAGHWQARFPAVHRTYGGPGPAPARLASNQLLRLALGQPPATGWTWRGSLEDQWRLENTGSGEWIEGTRLP